MHKIFLTHSIYCISCLVCDRWMCHICGERQMASVLVDALNTLHHRAFYAKCVKCGVGGQIRILCYVFSLSHCLTLTPAHQ